MPLLIECVISGGVLLSVCGLAIALAAIGGK